MTGSIVMPRAPVVVAEAIPAELRAMRNWLTWKYEPPKKPGAKPRKVPYWIGRGRRHGLQGTPGDRAGMGTFEEALVECQTKDRAGIGFAPFEGDGIIALDFDDCIDQGGNVEPDLLELLVGTYAEISPSGRGLRAFYRGHQSELGNRKPDSRRVEIFQDRGYVTVTGNALPGAPATVAELPGHVAEFLAAQFERRGEVATGNVAPRGWPLEQIRECLEALPDDLEYDEWIIPGMAVHHETRGSDEGFEIWHEKNRQSKKHTSREYDLERWVSFGKPRRDGRPQVTIATLHLLAGRYGVHVPLDPPASADDFEDLTPTVDKPMRFAVVPAVTFAQGKAPAWLIKGVLPQAPLVVLYGEPGSGKTFAVLDLAASIARGVPWRDRRVRQGRVVYVAAEGAGGFRNRLVAYAQHHGIELEDLPLGVIPAGPNLLLRGDVKDLVEAIKASGGAELVVIDTLAQAMPGGNENSGEDVGKALAHCRTLHEVTGATVVLVHHSGKDATKGARGWSGLKAAADAELEVARSPLGRVLSVTKQKDGEDGGRFGFELRTVMVGIDEDGDPIDSCVVAEAEVLVGRPPEPTHKNQREVLRVARELLAESTTVPREDLVKAAASVLPAPEPGRRDRRPERVREALDALVEAGHLVADGDLIVPDGYHLV